MVAVRRLAGVLYGWLPTLIENSPHAQVNNTKEAGIGHQDAAAIIVYTVQHWILSHCIVQTFGKLLMIEGSEELGRHITTTRFCFSQGVKRKRKNIVV